MVRQIYQFKITLLDIQPKIWRRIQIVSTGSFWNLHVAIQDSMGWTDSHLHAFDVINPKSGENETIVSYTEDSNEQLTWHVKVRDYIACNNKMTYQYDFGDDWQHLIELEKTLEKEPGKRYPVCLGGQRACPPEDVGGVTGYEEFLEIIADKTHPQYKDMINWVGRKFDPEYFDPTRVHFDNPTERLKFTLS